jgi:hypothetical protein
MKETQGNARKALDKYAWPGGYPIMYLAREGWRDSETGKLDFNPHDKSEAICCPGCAEDVERWPDLIIIAHYIHYEGPPEQCEWCSEFTESAYGDPEETEETTTPL